MRPRGQRRRITCEKQDRFEKQTTWRDWSASCLKGCIYLYINGIVVKTLRCWTFVWECGNFLDILHVKFMFIEPSKWPADQDAWFTLQSKGCISSKKTQTSYTSTHVSEILTSLETRSLMSWKNCARRVYSLKRIGTFSWKPDQIDLQCNFGTPRASKQQLLHAWSLHIHVLECETAAKREGLLAYDLHTLQLIHKYNQCCRLWFAREQSFEWFLNEAWTKGNGLLNLLRVTLSVTRTFHAATRE